MGKNIKKITKFLNKYGEKVYNGWLFKNCLLHCHPGDTQVRWWLQEGKIYTSCDQYPCNKNKDKTKVIALLRFIDYFTEKKKKQLTNAHSCGIIMPT